MPDTGRSPGEMENGDTAPASEKPFVCRDIRLASQAACLSHSSRLLLSLPSHQLRLCRPYFPELLPTTPIPLSLPPLTALPRWAVGLLPACVTRCQSVRDIRTKYHRLGGLHNRNFSQFWRPRVQDRGVGRFGFFCGLSPWLTDGCLLPRPPLVFPLYVSVS